MDGSEILPNKITLQSMQDANNNYTLTLTHASAPDGMFVSFNLLQADVGELKVRGICLDNSTCFLSVTDSVVKDMSGIGANTILVLDAISVSNFVSDEKRPYLVSFDLLNYDEKIMVLNFSEIVDPLSLNATNLQLLASYEVQSDEE